MLFYKFFPWLNHEFQVHLDLDLFISLLQVPDSLPSKKIWLEYVQNHLSTPAAIQEKKTFQTELCAPALTFSDVFRVYLAEKCNT